MPHPLTFDPHNRDASCLLPRPCISRRKEEEEGEGGRGRRQESEEGGKRKEEEGGGRVRREEQGSDITGLQASLSSQLTQSHLVGCPVV